MKKLLLLMTFVICVLSVNAQNTKVITGAVIDKNGNPLPNALVEATGGAENVTTDADGTFRIEVPIWLKSLTAKYAGCRDKKIKIKDKSRLIFDMKPKGEECWFLDAVYSANFSSDYFTRIGLMGGYLGNWGGYAKVLMPLETEDAIPSVTVGVIKQVAQPVYLYFGAGYSPVFEYIRWGYWNYYDGAMFDIGAIIRIKKFNVGIGYSFSTSFENVNNSSVQISVGYCF